MKLFQRKPNTGSKTTADVSTFEGALSRGIECRPNEIPTFRRMRTNPVIAIARMAAHAPIKASGPVSFQAEGSEAAVEACEKYLSPIWSHYLRQVLFAMDYGYSVAEVVWARGPDAFYPVRIRGLMPEDCKAMVSKETGTVDAVEWNRKITLPEGSFVWFTYGGEGDNPYGESRLRNCYKAWKTWESAIDRLDRYLSKVAGVIPMIEYPEGESFDATGNKKDNFELAKKLLEALSSGQGVVMPNVLAKYATDFAARGITPNDLKAWTIGFIETKGTHGPDFEASLRTLDRYMVRGYLCPERSITEGTHGTKAESEVQSEFVIHEGEDFLKLAAEEFDRRIRRPFVEWNFGTAAADDIKTVAPTIVDENLAFIRGIVEKVLTTPATFSVLSSLIEIDSMFDLSGVPMRPGVDIAAELDNAKADASVVNTPPEDPNAPGAVLSRIYRSVFSEAV